MILNVSLHPNIPVTLLTSSLGVAASNAPGENQGSSECQHGCDTTAGCGPQGAAGCREHGLNLRLHPPPTARGSRNQLGTTQATWRTHQQRKWPKCQLATQPGTVCDPKESLVTYMGEPGINENTKPSKSTRMGKETFPSFSSGQAFPGHFLGLSRHPRPPAAPSGNDWLGIYRVSSPVYCCSPQRAAPAP